MLSELIKQGFGVQEDYNCAEKILYGANQAYQLGLDRKALKLSAGFGGGMAIGSVCGALTASVMVLSHLFVKNNAHASPEIKTLTQELFAEYEKAMGCTDCIPLKEKYCLPEVKCLQVIDKAAEILDSIVLREKGKNK
ncbi:putative membrane protein [Propionispora sp. 2/2-37]|uniref:C-GCAxxG-C-C family (seleno)protein n=1 Tax=Propionispora sp. 2/2-37 TaxID=1677858 RepID=UPI0006BB994E|nr:C-GCAxxG-C-C family (seleno)protein [Propionispora sp. 2/2-37]CUH95923.1 putative membrane protein [Propionispora sp. 2/2-37]